MVTVDTVWEDSFGQSKGPLWLIRPDVDSVVDTQIRGWLMEAESRGFVPASYAIFAESAEAAFSKLVDTGDTETGVIYHVNEIHPGTHAEFTTEERIVEL